MVGDWRPVPQGSGRSPEVSVGPLGRQETAVDGRQTDYTMKRGLEYRVYLVDYGAEREGGRGREKGRRKERGRWGWGETVVTSLEEGLAKREQAGEEVENPLA